MINLNKHVHARPSDIYECRISSTRGHCIVDHNNQNSSIRHHDEPGSSSNLMSLLNRSRFWFFPNHLCMYVPTSGGSMLVACQELRNQFVLGRSSSKWVIINRSCEICNGMFQICVPSSSFVLKTSNCRITRDTPRHGCSLTAATFMHGQLNFSKIML
jgi:hypothetical protein